MILIGVGANLPGPDGSPPLVTCRWALGRLARLPGLRLAAASRWYRTRPVPASDQPDYVNGAARLEGRAEPAALLAALHAIEVQAGRLRGPPNAARTLDLDLVAIGALVRPAPDPVLPHPRMHERGFVLRPLADVAPGWVHPLLGRTVCEMLAALPPDGAEPLVEPPD
jgi:2-amino-4-hydroxy-6-hydroxymethyldihydropteridine diphosphokinase